MKNSTLAGGSDSSSTADNSSSSDASNSTSSGATGNITWPCVKLEARRAQAIAWTNVTLPVAHKADDDDDEATQKRDVAGLRRDAADGNTAGSRRDALAIEKRSDEPGSTRDTAQILNQGATNVTVLNTTRFGPYILVSTVDAVLRAPGPLAEVLVRPEMNLTSLAAFLRYWNVTGDMEGAWVDGEHSGDASSRDGSDASNSSDASSQDGSDASSRNASDVPSLMGLFNHSSGYTLFAPSNDALIAAGEQMAAFAKNGTAFDVLLENHIINGTTMYSSELFPPPTSDGVAIQGKLAQNYTSGAGQTLSFTANETGRYIWSGDPPSSSARILHTDVLVDNGVAHIIGNVLFNFEDDWGKAKVATSLTSTSTPTSYYFDDDGSGNGVWPQLGSANGYLAYLIALVWVGIGAAVVV
ncbi:hypothetical protein BD626DRAFT_511226 [Schizophyllum amplum]|uniref:FAS1 domain-containing protein n=1 Tax=Schizophyllum amplum TaxID=97359 RepID=A0A550C125_9AGAR|nr:hypothetical protein BD626DRAFT_511226 [Auriculariopsis ampla]